ncbi:hypothetical protein IV203_014950 [Nitzschia inconspicua]|uniref:Integrase catalytic domain-containing protein n=1 Tax=Nitzschia inconspicua TaxID=303405 RepID=A0A9K3PSU1_9STRA|nr:hypothetical protein IV203_014950 [Nitzschia inconspicua]
MTSDEEWDPSILDGEADVDTEEWFDTVTTRPPEEAVIDRRFDNVGDYRHRHVMNHAYVYEHDEDEIFHDAQLLLEANERVTVPNETDYESVRPMLGWQSIEVIKRTFEATTQFVTIPMSNVLRKTFRSPNPAANVLRRPEDVAMDTVFSDVPAIDSGEMAAQIFVGVKSLVTDAEGLKRTDQQFVNTLEDNIRKRGAMNRLISDRSQAEISNKVKDILRALHIRDWQSEPFHQHQNFAERRIQEVKRMSNTILDRTGAPPYLWLQAVTYTCFLLNHLATPSLQWRTPIECLTGRTPDISPLLRFRFYEPVHYRAKNGEIHRARIVSAIEDHEKELGNIPERTKFLLSINGDTYEDVMTYNDLMEHIQSQSTTDATVWKYKKIISHSGPSPKKYIERMTDGYIWMFGSIYFFGDMANVPSSSLMKSHPRWKSMGPVPLSLNAKPLGSLNA